MDYSIKGLYAASMSALKVDYGKRFQIALDLSTNAVGFTNGEIKFIIENFFWFADEVIFVPQEVLECRE